MKVKKPPKPPLKSDVEMADRLFAMAGNGLNGRRVMAREIARWRRRLVRSAIKRRVQGPTKVS